MAVLQELFDKAGKRLIAFGIAGNTDVHSPIIGPNQAPVVDACEASRRFYCDIAAILYDLVDGRVKNTSAP